MLQDGWSPRSLALQRARRLAGEAELVPCPKCYWISDDLLLDFSLPKFARRVKDKIAALSRSMVGKFGGRCDSLHSVTDYMDVSHYSSTHVGYMNALYKALRAYVPRHYPGSILLYKSRTQPLYHLIEAERAWPAIASHVDVVVVPGTHISIVREPYVGAVAADLRQRIAAIRARAVA